MAAPVCPSARPCPAPGRRQQGRGLPCSGAVPPCSRHGAAAGCPPRLPDPLAEGMAEKCVQESNS